MSTYLIFNQLQIIHPQFRPKSRSSVLEPSQNFLSNTTGRVSRCLKPTVWTVEQSVSGVLYISSLLRSPKLPKRKGISPVGPKVQQPPRGGTWVDDTCRHIKILWDTSIIEQMAVRLLRDRSSRDGRITVKINFYRKMIAGPIIVGFLHGNTTGRVSRCLKPTVWTVEQSVSGVLYISSLLRSPKLPKRKGISPVGPKVQQPPRGGTWVDDTCRHIKILWDTSIIEQMAVRLLRDRSSRDGQIIVKINFYRKEGYVSLLPYANDRENTHARDGRHALGCSRSRDLVLPRTSFCSLKYRNTDTTGRVSRCLKPTVWTVEQSVSGVLYISSLLRSPKLPKRKGISPVGPKVQQPPRGGTWVGITCDISITQVLPGEWLHISIFD
ncbi:neurotrimin-like isoform X2 [Vespula maculifrons]|uniref:Neurotrimin-like isoform X2 n=1 Tax=Vespula maculifrons TaxID=7453 RepID=A0ABD2BJ85_VESMC